MKVTRNMDGDVLIVDDAGRTHMLHKLEGFDRTSALIKYEAEYAIKQVEERIERGELKRDEHGYILWPEGA